MARPEGSYTQTIRVLRLLDHLRAVGGAGAFLDDIAALLGVSSRTVRRDIAALVRAGLVKRLNGEPGNHAPQHVTMDGAR